MAKQNHIFRKIRKGSQAEKLAEVLIDRPVSSAVRSLNTISALAEAGLGLKVECTACGETLVHSSDKLAKTFGAKTAVSEVRQPCAACGSEATSIIPS